MVEVFDLVVAAGQPCVVMEYVDGESLAARIGRLGRLAPVDAARLMGQVAGALHAAHRAGIVHGDVKPANILIDAAGNAKLADFGIARGAGGLAPTRTGQLTGTLAYTAPEAARTGELTSAGDVWSLGATLYAALEGQAPYHDDDDDGQDPASLLARLVTPMPRPTRSAELTPILLQMLSGEPAERPTPKQVISRLAAFHAPPADTPAGPRPVPVAEARAAADPQDTVSRPGSRSYAATMVVAAPDVEPTVLLAASEHSTHNRRTRCGPWLLLGLTIPVITAVVAAMSLASAPQPGPGPGAPHPDRVVKTIAASFTLGMAVAPDGQHLYLTNIYGGVSVIDTASSVVRTFSLVLDALPGRPFRAENGDRGCPPMSYLLGPFEAVR